MTLPQLFVNTLAEFFQIFIHHGLNIPTWIPLRDDENWLSLVHHAFVHEHNRGQGPGA